MLALAAAVAARHHAEKRIPKPISGVYSSVNYAITFPAPSDATYCPLPDTWVGSDHGTSVFLHPPRVCQGVGFPSSSRGFKPNVRRIDVYYGYVIDDGETYTPEKCRSVGKITLLGKAHALCRSTDPHGVVLWSGATYFAGLNTQLVVTLVSTPNHLRHDLARFRTFAASVRTCSQVDRDVGGHSLRWGTGPRCPKSEWF